MITIAASIQKGGTGKSTSVSTLGAILASNGRRVLMVDCDPQSSLSQALGFDCPGRSLAETIGGSEPGRLPLARVIRQVRPGLDLAPADIALASSELGLVVRLGRESVLKAALDQVRRDYDVCLIDCPPSLGLLTINGLVAARAVISPTLPSVSDLRGLALFVETLEKIRAINPDLVLLGVVVTQFDTRVTAHRQVLEMIERQGLPVLGTVPRSVRVQEAQGRNAPLTEYDPGGRVLAAYHDIAKGLETWLNNNNH
jgi:chromosome partitioning protein